MRWLFGLGIAAVACVAGWLWDERRGMTDTATCYERYVLPAHTARAASKMVQACDLMARPGTSDDVRRRIRCELTYIPRTHNIPAMLAAESMCWLRTK